MEEDTLCYVCYDREMTKDLTCSHKLCGLCYELSKKCPMCRTPYYKDEIYHDFDDDDDYKLIEFMIDSVALLFTVSLVTFSLIFFFF